MRDFPQYPQATAAAQPRRRKIHWPSVVSAGVVLAIAVIAVITNAIISSPARSAADHAAVVSPTATPGPPVPQRIKPTEYSPKISDTVPGDGTWLVGREIKRGTYRTEGGNLCFWARLKDLSGEDSAVYAQSYVPGRQVVALGPDDVAFQSYGCGSWVMIP